MIPELKAMVAKGVDPIKYRNEQEEKAKAANRIKQHTFMPVARDYIDAHRSSWKSDKHTQQWENTLVTYVEPVFKDTPVSSIDIELVLKVLKPIWTKKAETASRIRGRIETVLNYAKSRKYRTGENPAAWRGNLDMLLPANSKVKRTKHHPALPFDSAPEFMKELRNRIGMGARALELLILTAARSGSIRAAEWSEIDFDKELWTIPAEHMKGSKSFTIPLSGAAISLLKALPRMTANNLIFPSPRKNCELSDSTLNRVIELMNIERSRKALPKWIDPNYDKEVVAHGFRSTFRDWGAENTSYSNEMLEIALAHTVSDQTEAAYRRGDMLKKRKQLMDDWARHCEINDTSNVVSIKAAVK
jgi:integrase